MYTLTRVFFNAPWACKLWKAIYIWATAVEIRVKRAATALNVHLNNLEKHPDTYKHRGTYTHEGKGIYMGLKPLL